MGVVVCIIVFFVVMGCVGYYIGSQSTYGGRSSIWYLDRTIDDDDDDYYDIE